MLNVRPIAKFVAVISLLLTLWSALAVVAHHHAKGTESAKCSVCVAAHSATPKACVAAVRATFTSLSAFCSAAVPAKKRFVAFVLSVRPPPATA